MCCGQLKLERDVTDYTCCWSCASSMSKSLRDCLSNLDDGFLSDFPSDSNVLGSVPAAARSTVSAMRIPTLKLDEITPTRTAQAAAEYMRKGKGENF